MIFSFVKRICTTKNSIFYSVINYKNKLLSFGRRHYQHGRVIKKIILDNNFNIKEDNNNLYIGEDPRCFIFRDKLYVIDNHFNDVHLIEYETSRYIKINAPGKNFSFVVHKNELYFIHFIKPFMFYKFDIDTGKIEHIEVDDDKNTLNFEFRGGTPGYKLSTNSYYGFGHRTYQQNDIVKHDIFMWTLYFIPNGLPKIELTNVEQPKNSKNICDPTSVVIVNDKKYLITAETDRPWFCEQDYVTNLYEIVY